MVPNDWVQGEEHLPIAFQAKTGRPSSQPGNAAKRRGTLGGRIVYGVGKGRRQGFRSVAGVMLPMAFIDQRSQAEFNRVGAELPAEMAHQLWVVVEGLDVRAMKPSRRSCHLHADRSVAAEPLNGHHECFTTMFHAPHRAIVSRKCFTGPSRGSPA